MHLDDINNKCPQMYTTSRSNSKLYILTKRVVHYLCGSDHIDPSVRSQHETQAGDYFDRTRFR